MTKCCSHHASDTASRPEAGAPALGSESEIKSRIPKFGIRFFKNGHELRILQLSGGGRIMIEDSNSNRRHWSTVPRGATFESYEADYGQLYSNRDIANDVCRNIKKY
jgi:hypothetical protein